MLKFPLFLILSSIMADGISSRTIYDVHYDSVKEEEYETVIQVVLSLGYQHKHFDRAGCEAWCTRVIPPYFPAKVDLTPRCEQECHRFLHMTTYQEVGDL